MESRSHSVSHSYLEIYPLIRFRYAMLVGALPFRADSQEITRRRIREFNYDWPDMQGVQVSIEAKRLVANLLVEPQSRSTPDELVGHPFLTEGRYLEKICPDTRFAAPCNPRHGRDRDLLLFQQYCKLAGVGKEENGQHWPCVGTEECINSIGDSSEGTLITLPFKWR